MELSNEDLREVLITLVEAIDSLPPQHEKWRQNLFNLYAIAVLRHDVVYALLYEVGALTTIGQAVFTKLKDLE